MSRGRVPRWGIWGLPPAPGAKELEQGIEIVITTGKPIRQGTVVSDSEGEGSLDLERSKPSA
jgi:hypothetical protein